MTVFRHNNIKILAAGFLLAIMLFIQAEKTFHHHNHISNSVADTGIHHFSQNAVCAICQYVFAREAVLPVEFLSQQIVLHFKEENTHLQKAVIPIVFFTTVSRGPPAC